eukprot:387138_1
MWSFLASISDLTPTNMVALYFAGADDLTPTKMDSFYGAVSHQTAFSVCESFNMSLPEVSSDTRVCAEFGSTWMDATDIGNMAVDLPCAPPGMNNELSLTTDKGIFLKQE